MTTERLEQLYFVTGSPNKFNDYQFLLGKHANLRWARYSIEEPVTVDLDILIRRKVELARPWLPHLPFLVEQTNLMIHAWKNLPGNATGMFIDGVGVEGICKMLRPFEDWSATVVTDLAYHAPNGLVEVFRGQLSGTIAAEPRGERVYGWDVIFIPEGQGRTFAEMPMEQRHTISTRKLAVAAFFAAVLEEEHPEVLLQNRIRLRQLMMRHFNRKELEALLFELSINVEEFDDSKSNFEQEIILYCERRGRIPELLAICRRERPSAQWPEAL
jgi:XTP/dITP diphosphohydrolase